MNDLLEEKNKDVFKIEISNFEGPLDLLCFLISKNKMNIFDISLSEITDEYIAYLDHMQSMNLDIATEFLVMASNLLYIKSKKLLPVIEPEDDEEENELTEEQLINRILEYKQYKEKLEDFKTMYAENFGTFEKQAETIKVKREWDGKFNVSLQDFYNIYKNVEDRNKEKLNKNAKNVENIVTYEKVTIRSKVKQIIDLFKKKTSFVFSNVYNVKKDRKIDIVTAFLSVLELSRLKHVNIEQKDMFGDIVVKKVDMKSIDLSLIEE